MQLLFNTKEKRELAEKYGNGFAATFVSLIAEYLPERKVTFVAEKYGNALLPISCRIAEFCRTGIDLMSPELELQNI